MVNPLLSLASLMPYLYNLYPLPPLSTQRESQRGHGFDGLPAIRVSREEYVSEISTTYRVCSSTHPLVYLHSVGGSYAPDFS